MSRVRGRVAAGFTAIIAAGGIAVLASGSALASATPVATQTSEWFAGYGTIDTGNTTFNDVRSNLQNLPSFGGTDVGTVAHGVVFQQDATGLTDPSFGLGLVNGTNASGTCDNGGNPATQWILKWGYDKIPARTPLKPNELVGGASWTSGDGYVYDGDSFTCVAPGTPNFYVEAYDSTLYDSIGLDAGYTEPGDNVTNGIVFGGTGPEGISLESFGLGGDVRFHQAGVGVAANDGEDFGKIASGTVFQTNRNGLSILLHPTEKASPTNGRATFDSEPMVKFIATQNGNAVAPGNLLVGSPGGFGSGSRFAVTIATP